MPHYNMNFRQIISLSLVSLFLSCNQRTYIEKIEGEQIPISDSLASDSKVEAFVKPFRENINKDLDSVIAYSVDTYSKSDGELNTAIGNLMADIVLEQSNPIFKSRTGKEIDMVLLNHGGIRSILSKGDVTKRTAYEIMPFENSVVVVKLAGEQVMELIEFLLREQRPHPISKLNIAVDKDFNLLSARVNGFEIDPEKSYYVATNDYLFNGGDDMDFFKKNKNVFVLDYKIRNTMIDYFMKVDTLRPTIDDRFVILN